MEFCILQPSVKEGRQFMKSQEGMILQEFIKQQEKWLEDNDVKLIQLQPLMALKRTGKRPNIEKEVDSDMSLSEVLMPRKYVNSLKGITYKDDLASEYGSILASSTRKADAVLFSKRGIVIIEIKSNLSKSDHYDGHFAPFLTRLPYFSAPYLFDSQ